MDNKAKYYFRDYALDDQIDAAECANKYVIELGWHGSLITGTLPNGDYVAVFE